MYKKRIWIFCLLITGCLYYLPAAGQDYIFKRYTTSDGLINEVIIDLIEDSHGFLWIGTSSGISRFDGKNFKNYGFTEGLQSLVVSKIYEDKLHRLWIGTSKGIAELRGNHFFMHHKNKVDEAWVWNISEVDGFGLLAFTDMGTFRYDDSVWNRLDPLPEYTKKVCMEIVDADGGYYMNYEDAVIFKKKDKPITILLKDTTDGSEVYCNGITKINGKVYAGVQNKFYEIENGRLHLLIDSIPIGRFFNYVMDTNDIIWVNISDKGLYKYQLLPQNRKKVSLFEYDSNTAGAPFIDHQGNLWIISYEGLIKVLPKVFEEIVPPKVNGAGKRINVLPGVDKEVIISNASGLYILNDKKFEKLARPPSYKDEESYGEDIVEGFAKDNRGFTWVMTRQRKMLCWNGTQLLDYSSLLPRRSADYIRNLAINPVNNTVFICDDSTLISGNEKKFGVYTDNTGNHFPKTTSALFTHNGIGIVNVFSQGIYFITRNNEIIKAPPELEIIDKGSYTYFYEDNEGWIWISNAGKGLVHFRIDENNYEVKDLSILTTAQGLPANKIGDMTFDTEGGTWITCSNGVVVLKHNPTDNKVWDVYTIGKEQDILLPAPLGMKADNVGNVWLASLDKIVKIDTRKLILKKVVPDVVIEKVLLNMKETNWSKYSDSVHGFFQLPESFNLNYAQNTLGIEFSGVSLYNADFFEYSYMLEPMEKTWSSPSPNKFISLVNLSPGKYVFKVKTRCMGTAWSKPEMFSFSISPPYWETWWFRLLVIVTAAAVIIGIYRNRVKKIQEQADVQNQLRELEMKALKAQMNPHFIYNALNSIQSLIADEKRSEAINYIGTFSRLLRQVLEYTENNVISLEKEMQTLRLYIQLESLRLNMNLEYTVTTDDELIAENEKVPPLILQPFVENALWHGLSRREGNKRLTISVSQKGNNLICIVEDNGIGRSNAAAHKKQTDKELYAPRGVDITIKRLIDFNRNKEAPVVYYDLLDESGNAIGTRVLISIKRQNS